MIIKRFLIGIFILCIVILFFFMNPQTSDYINFTEAASGVSTPETVKIERINFFVFSTYTPMMYEESGTTHLGVLGQFVQISDGQFDYPEWLNLFN